MSAGTPTITSGIIIDNDVYINGGTGSGFANIVLGGNETFVNATTGGQNTAIGGRALKFTTTGSNNTAI
jgi:hypothetical protein